MGVFAVHNLFQYTMAGIGGVLAGIAIAGASEPKWKRLLGVAFFIACVGVVLFAASGM